MSFFPAKYFQTDLFLSADENALLIDWVLGQRNEFVDSTTTTKVDGWRVSKVLFSHPGVVEEIIERVYRAAIQLTPVLGLRPFQLGKTERQITAHNDGCFYKVHTDNSSEQLRDRAISYVIYFNQEPKEFTGGELRIYDLKVERGAYKQAKTYSTLHPRNNSLILFPSHFYHEVLPVNCPSQAFENSRFTLNGWIRKARS